ncbi:MAG TPA: SAM-dependent methyltransferase, partial [Actinomycetales bacterium]|nr:SAM-dependent methyltransferase [Actinomycetales bacterium]
MSQNESANAPLVAFIGAGPGDLGLVTSRAATLLSRAQVVIVDDSVSREIVLHHADPEAEVVTVESTESGAVHLRKALAEKPELVVRLVAGEGASDPALAAELAAVRKQNAEVELIPGVSPSTAVPAYAGLVPTSDWAMHVVIDTGIVDELEPLAKSAVAADAPIVVRGIFSEVLSALDLLVRSGQPNDSHVVLAIRGTTVDQRTFRGILRGIRTKTKAFDADAPAVAIVTAKEAIADENRWFDRRALFGWR